MFRVLNQVWHIYILISKHTWPNLKVYICQVVFHKKITHPKQQQNSREKTRTNSTGSTFFGCQVKVGGTIRILMEASPSGMGILPDPKNGGWRFETTTQWIWPGKRCIYIYIHKFEQKMVNKNYKVDPAWQQLSSSLALSEEKCKGIVFTPSLPQKVLSHVEDLYQQEELQSNFLVPGDTVDASEILHQLI